MRRSSRRHRKYHRKAAENGSKTSGALRELDTSPSCEKILSCSPPSPTRPRKMVGRLGPVNARLFMRCLERKSELSSPVEGSRDRLHAEKSAGSVQRRRDLSSDSISALSLRTAIRAFARMMLPVSVRPLTKPRAFDAAPPCPSASGTRCARADRGRAGCRLRAT